MNNKIAYKLYINHRSDFVVFIKRITAFLLILFSINCKCFADVDPETEYEFDEIMIYLNVPQIGSIEIPAVIRAGKAYLPITDIFNFLKIKTVPSPDFDSITGFFITPDNPYTINKVNNNIIYGGKVYVLSPEDFVRTETNLYMKSDYFGQIFGLECAFNFRSLSVTLTTKLDLPAIREMRQEMMRKNINRLKGVIKADTSIGRNFPFFNIGMADWSVLTTQQQNGLNDIKLNLALGSIFAGGELKGSVNYNNNFPFKEKQQYYLWRFVNNDKNILKQTIIGKISPQATSTIFSPVVGLQLTNTPTTYRRSFGTYTLSNYTEPGWIVELYVNNILVDYVKADASGFYKFDVPLVYGNSNIKLRFYSPWGEERLTEQNINIPVNFLQVNQLEYTFSAGMVEDDKKSRFSRAVFNYGVNRSITVSGGMEYLSSVTTGNYIPFFNSSIRLSNNLIFSNEYTHGVRARGILMYHLPSNIQFDLNYTRYKKGQKAIIYNQIEERKIVISMPIRTQLFSLYSRFTANQLIFSATQYTASELLFSGSVFGVNTNFTVNGLFSNSAPAYFFSNLSLSFRLPKNFILTPQTQYVYNKNKFISVKCGLEKRIFSYGFINISYEKYFSVNADNLLLNLRYELPFAQTSISARRNNKLFSYSQSASGSLLYDSKTNKAETSSRSNVGKGALTIIPFLDINGNMKYDKGEPKTEGMDLRINSGRIKKNKKDTTIHIIEIEPYTNCFIEFDANAFENISWQIHHKTISVIVDANQFKIIEVPVSVVSEASGTVYYKTKSDEYGLGRINVCFYNKDSILVASTLTEPDGYYTYLGLTPGIYTACIDTSQLRKLQMVSTPSSIPFIVVNNKEGNIIEGLDFKINLKKPEKQVIIDTIPMTIKIDIPKKEIVNNDIVYKVQFASSYKRQPLNSPDFKGLQNVQEYFNEGVYRYLAGNETSSDSVIAILKEVRDKGFNDAFIVAFLNGEKFSPQHIIKYNPYISDADIISAEKSKNLINKKDIVFKVQFASSFVKKPLNSPDFKGLQDVQEYYKNKIYCYITGNESTIDSATILLNKIQALGFNDAFVAAFLNNQKFSPEYIAAYEDIKDEEQIEKLNISKGVSYKIQIISSYINRPVNSPYFKGIKDIQVYKQNGINRYFVGNESSSEAAMILLEDVYKKGFKNAFIVRFVGGKKIETENKEFNKNIEEPIILKQTPVLKYKTLQDTITINKTIIPADTTNKKYQINIKKYDTKSNNKKTPLKNKSTINNIKKNKNIDSTAIKNKTIDITKKNNDTTKAEIIQKLIPNSTDASEIKGLFFTVQIGVYKKPDVSKFNKLTDIIVEKYDNKYRICDGKFYNLLDVKIHKEKIVSKGYKDAYIVAYYNGKKISNKEAKRIYYNK